MRIVTPEERREAALEFARRRLPVFPVHTPCQDGSCSCRKGAGCASPGKHPRIAAWQSSASTDPDIIRDWWNRWPNANLGVPMGKVSGVIALDVDRRSGGLEALEMLEAEHGALPKTSVAHTGGGGRHHLFRYPRGGIRSAVICPGIELKSDGTFILVAPSTHASGGVYQWET